MNYRLVKATLWDLIFKNNVLSCFPQNSSLQNNHASGTGYTDWEAENWSESSWAYWPLSMSTEINTSKPKIKPHQVHFPGTISRASDLWEHICEPAGWPHHPQGSRGGCQTQRNWVINACNSSCGCEDPISQPSLNGICFCNWNNLKLSILTLETQHFQVRSMLFLV